MKSTLNRLKGILRWSKLPLGETQETQSEGPMRNRSVETQSYPSSERERFDDTHSNAPIDRRSQNQPLDKHEWENKQILFPPEIWFEVAYHSAFTATRPVSGNAATYIVNKAKAGLLQHLGSVSKFHRQLALRYWAHTVRILEQADIEKLRYLGEANNLDLMSCVRCLMCTNEYNIYRTPKHAFAEFSFAEELIIHCHSDINFGGEFGQQQNPPINVQAQAQEVGAQNNQLAIQGNPTGNVHPQPGIFQPARMSYRRLRVNLPSTLHTLRVYDSHVPDIYFIQQVAEQCPLLEALTLARCTLFTHQGCEFWRRLPRSESDAYFSDQGIPAYAAAIGRELGHIKNLKELQMGIYLTSHSALDTHLEQHAGLGLSSEAGLEVWEEQCEQCGVQYHKSTVAAEVEATEALAKEVPTLLTVSWASFCSEKRVGWSTHRVLRDETGNFQGVS